MHWILLIILILTLLVIYRLDGKNILTPAVISVAVYILSSFIFALNSSKWDIQLDIVTVLIIISALLVFYFGTRVHLSIGKPHIAGFEELSNTLYHYAISKWVIALFFLFNCFATLLIYRRAMQISSSYVTSSFVLSSIRAALSTEDVSWGLGISVVRESMYALGYICIGVFLINVVPNLRKNIKNNMYLLLPIIPMLVSMFLSTGRTGFIRVLTVVFVVGTMVYSYTHVLRIGKFFKIGILVFAVLLIVFFQLGKATGKSQIFSPFDTISVYAGSSIGALNEYLKNPSSFSEGLFGGETLYGLRYWARLFNKNIVSTKIALPFTYVKGGYNTNVYTALRRYINDYGFIGMYLIQFIKGVIFGSWSYSLRKNKRIGLSLILYGYFMYDIVLQSIEENFLRELFTTAQIFILIVFYFSFKFFVLPYKQCAKEE